MRLLRDPTFRGVPCRTLMLEIGGAELEVARWWHLAPRVPFPGGWEVWPRSISPGVFLGLHPTEFSLFFRSARCGTARRSARVRGRAAEGSARRRTLSSRTRRPPASFFFSCCFLPEKKNGAHLLFFFDSLPEFLDSN